MGWGHEGFITQIARDKLYGPVDVKMTSTPILTPSKPGHKAKPTNLTKTMFSTLAKTAPPTPIKQNAAITSTPNLDVNTQKQRPKGRTITLVLSKPENTPTMTVKKGGKLQHT